MPRVRPKVTPRFYIGCQVSRVAQAFDLFFGSCHAMLFDGTTTVKPTVTLLCYATDEGILESGIWRLEAGQPPEGGLLA